MKLKLYIFASLFLLQGSNGLAQYVSIPNPILFVAQVPIPRDSGSITASFSNHIPDPLNCGRGSDLYIIYPDGTLKNLTQLAGYGVTGFQGANSIAVRQPSMHWSGKKAIFAMVIGAPEVQGEVKKYFWQIYEVSGLGEDEAPVITRVPYQPTTYNNLSPIYGTDDRIIFSSDRPRNGESQLFPLLDERVASPSVTGLWSLDPVTGDLFQMNVSPSGVFSPFVDSYGRVVFTRWDHLQRDPVADRDALGITHNGPFNYSDESATATILGGPTEIFPEPEPVRRDLLKGTNSNGLTFNQLFPWQINEDGTSEETLNHCGRHDFLSSFVGSLNDDPNVTAFDYATSDRLNDSTSIQNLLQLYEDPLIPGTYYGVNVIGMDVHSAAQIVTLTAAPSLDPAKSLISYITHKSTASGISPSSPVDPSNSGHYRNPLPLSNGRLLAVHTADPHVDKNAGMRSKPISLDSFRIVTMKKNGDFWIADSLLTPGIAKSLSYWDPDTLVSFTGILWELDPVEVRSRQKPSLRANPLPVPEQKVFTEEGVDITDFRKFMRSQNLGMIVSRNVTHRDNSDHQQPYYLKVHGSSTLSNGAHGKIYDVSLLQLYQGDQVRGYHFGNSTPAPGRRVLAQLMHDTAMKNNPPSQWGPRSLVGIAPDGSFASFVPSRRAISWALVDSNLDEVVRERYWVTTQPGEVRVCASCHGTNDDALIHLDPPPQNEPEALRSLLKFWKVSHMPLSTELVYPPNDSAGLPGSVELVWQKVKSAKSYQVAVSSTEDFQHLIYGSPLLSDTNFMYGSVANGSRVYWRVKAFDDLGDSASSGIWSFLTMGGSFVKHMDTGGNVLSVYPNPASKKTTFTFSLVHSGFINISLFDLLGQQASTVAEGYFGAGKHSVGFDLSKFSEGIYYCRIREPEGIISQEIRIVH